MRRPADVPAYEPDLYATPAILDPHPHYAGLRRLGPVVWLTKQRVYALPRYAQCKAVLRDDTTFISGEGVALNRIFNRLSRGTTLNSDGDEHDQRRKLVAHQLLPQPPATQSAPASPTPQTPSAHASTLPADDGHRRAIPTPPPCTPNDYRNPPDVNVSTTRNTSTR